MRKRKEVCFLNKEYWSDHRYERIHKTAKCKIFKTDLTLHRY